MADRKRNASNPSITKPPAYNIVKGTANTARPFNFTARSTRQTCSICFESRIPTDYPAVKDLPTASTHNLGICRACITRSITDDIAHKPRDRVGCLECGAPWDDYFLRLYAEPEAFAVFEALDVLRVLEAMPEFRRCIRPGCGGGQLHDAADAAPIVTCIACGHKMCFTHRVMWHTGLSCADFDKPEETKPQTRERVRREEMEVRRTVRPCPRCNVDIEKDGGCDNMYCTRCSAGFSWQNQG